MAAEVMIGRTRPAAVRAVMAAAAAALAGLLGTASAGAATGGAAAPASYAPLSGSGSSWASVALDQWAQDVGPTGLTVNFNPDGSASGRSDYMQGSLVDFAASDPPFRDGQDQLGRTAAEHPGFGYSYVPDVGGGTAFMYHITMGGKLVTNLRLSGETIMKIFTGQITNWDDPAIASDYGARLPNEPITPVIHSDGSGATFFFTRWMNKVYSSQWDAFCQRVQPGIHNPCGPTEFYPQFGNARAENGSDSVSTYITSSYGEGSIGYDEYAYAMNAHWPVVAMLNPAGYYVLPTASNVAVALHQAIINENPGSPDYLQQDLDPVYTYTDPRSYPLSSYSYLIVPRAGTTEPPVFTSQAGAALSTYINYYLCAGQAQAAALGYSPLPYNLVTGAFTQVNQIPGTVGAPSQSAYASCKNPTFVNGQDELLNTAPFPGKCQKAGAPLNCDPSTGQAPGNGPSGTTPPTAAAGTGTGAPADGSITGGTSNASGSPGNGSVAGATITGAAANVPGTGANNLLLAVITGLAVAAAVAAPPSVAAYLRRRRNGVR
jgi:ABC-type phosphate transport system substrate-binding protein